MSDCWLTGETADRNSSCWMFPAALPGFVLLGRYGDIVQMLPCWKAIYDRTGMKPPVIVSTEYASVLDGVSYVEAHPIAKHWYQGVVSARQLAEVNFGGGIVPQWWQEEPARIRTLQEATKGSLILQCHGVSWGVDMKKWPDYGTSMADRCGFTREEWLRLPLVFDRRNLQREAELVSRVWRGPARPTLLYNFTGISSPFTFLAEVLSPFLRRFSSSFQLIDLGKVKAHRVYDLLGLYDRAVGLLTSDTLTLHLAPASNIPYIAWTVDGWTGSVPKGNCQLRIRYNETPRRVAEALAVVESWKQPPVNAPEPSMEPVYA